MRLAGAIYFNSRHLFGVSTKVGGATQRGAMLPGLAHTSTCAATINEHDVYLPFLHYRLDVVI